MVSPGVAWDHPSVTKRTAKRSVVLWVGTGLVVSSAILSGCSSASPKDLALSACNHFTKAGAGDPQVSAGTRKAESTTALVDADRAAKASEAWLELDTDMRIFVAYAKAHAYGAAAITTGLSVDCANAGQSP